MGRFRGRALSICHPLVLQTLAHITLTIQPLPTTALLGFGFHAPWQSVLLEDLGSLDTLGCTGLCEAACSQDQTVVLSRLCLGNWPRQTWSFAMTPVVSRAPLRGAQQCPPLPIFPSVSSLRRRPTFLLFGVGGEWGHCATSQRPSRLSTPQSSPFCFSFPLLVNSAPLSGKLTPLHYHLLNSVAYDINSMFQVLQHFGFGEFKDSSTKMLLL